MPRPKVKPQDRQRSARACLPCKASKIRCDAGEPCGPCRKRERISACLYLESNSKRQKTSPFPTPSIGDASPQYASPQFASPQFTSSRFAEDALPSQHAYAAPLATSTDRLATSAAATVTATTTPTPEPGQSASRQTQSRMLLSSKGEKLYVGETASLSFLQFLRQIMKKYMGPSAFTENQFKDNMLEVEMARDENPLTYHQSLEEKQSLIQIYREASSGIIDLYNTDEVQTFLDRHTLLSPSNAIESGDKHTRAEQAALNMMLAIGGQCRGQHPSDPFNAARSFTCAQKWAFEGYVCDPSLDIVRVFLLMAFYMLGACHRNAAFMYLGIASKAACALGLHRKEQYQGLDLRECQTRWRTWKSCLILDTIVSSILGRPGGLPTMRPEDDSAYDGEAEIGDEDQPRWMASRAVFGICSHIIELEQHLGNGNTMDSSTADAFLQRLREWNDTLSPGLRHFAGMKHAILGPADRELFIGSTQVACTYYFTIILVTRPFLITHLVSRIRRRRQAERQRSIDHGQQAQTPELAQACLDSAIFMAKTGHMALSSNLLARNMCIMKAWMLAAGLLLGFAMFAHIESVPEIDDAFQSAVGVLEHLAQASPQARHYFEILSTLSDAINTRREQLIRERRKKSGRYVSQIFTADFHEAGTPLPPSFTAASITPSSGPSNIDPGLTGSIDDMSNFDFDSTAFDVTGISHTEDWMDMPLLSDNLYIDWESLWPAMAP